MADDATESPRHQPDDENGYSGTGRARTCILVLGMHRSGTSAVARVVNLLGAALPENLLGEGPGNETGHWEPVRLMQLHDRLLSELGSSWDDWRGLSLKTQLSAERYQIYSNEIKEIIELEYGTTDVFVLKEPRICRFIPLYLEVLESINVEIRPILVVRNPLSVAASLAVRNGMETSKALACWLRYSLDAELGTRDLTRFVVTYEELLANWRSALREVITCTDIRWSSNIEEVGEEIDEFLSTSHRHHNYSSDELEVNPDSVFWVSRAYSALETLDSDPHGSTRSLNAIASEFDAATKFMVAASVADGIDPAQLSEFVRSNEEDANNTHAFETSSDNSSTGNYSSEQAITELQNELNISRMDLKKTLDELTTQKQHTAILESRIEHQALEIMEIGEKYDKDISDVKMKTDALISDKDMELKHTLSQIDSIRTSMEIAQRIFEAKEDDYMRDIDDLNFKLSKYDKELDKSQSELSSVLKKLKVCKIVHHRYIDHVNHQKCEYDSGTIHNSTKSFMWNEARDTQPYASLSKGSSANNEGEPRCLKRHEPTKDFLMVIPSINGGHLLERMLPSLRIPYGKVIVLDQGSDDNTKQICDQYGAELIQLHRPHTYTEACNIGYRIAKERDTKYLVVANNDIVFQTNVVDELILEMESDSNLAIVAPAQLIKDEAKSINLLAYRVFWNLEALRFEHDFSPPAKNTYRLESDFCELTLAVVRISAADDVGFLDDDYGFYFEDADFGFRLRRHGYSCAYLVRSQIEHYHSSTMSKESEERKIYYMEKNKKLFFQKNLGYGVSHANHNSKDANSWNVINVFLNKYLRLNGLIDNSKEELIFSHPGATPFDYLYTVWETTKLPEYWLQHKDSYRLVFAPSKWNVNVFREAGFNNVSFVPLGVETDIYNPWGETDRFSSELTFLWFSNNQFRKGLDVMVDAWRIFHSRFPRSKLVLIGRGIDEALPDEPDRKLRWGDFSISHYIELGIEIHESLKPASAEYLAKVYRSVDFYVNSSRSEGFGFTVAEAMACGTPAIFGRYGATAEFVTPNALTFSGTPVKADYSDKGFGDVGDWFEPDVENLAVCLEKAANLNADEYRRLSREGYYHIRNRYTWRNTIFSILGALEESQKPKTSLNDDQAHLAPATQVGVDPEQALSSADQPDSIKTTSVANHSDSITGPVDIYRYDRFSSRALTVRTFRRMGFLFTQCADRVETEGYRSAFSYARTTITSYLKSRAAWSAGKLRHRVKSLSSRIEVPKKRRGASAPRHGMLCIGYVEAGLGLGENLRSLIRALDTQDISYGIYPFNVAVEQRYIGPYRPDKYDTEQPYKVNLIYVAADQVPTVFSAIPGSLHENSYNILRTYWELPEAPASWRPMLDGIDEIWAPNAFVAAAFEGIFSGPISVIPPHVDIGSHLDLPNREMLGLEENRFYFMFSFDYYSSPFRKNPIGVLRAFEEAFPDRGTNVGLIIKSVGSKEHHPEIKQQLNEAVTRDPRIMIIDRSMSRTEMLGLIKAANCYVSLHRAEGFGLGMVEAMSFGNAVIGTAYSGSSEFVLENVAYPVSYDLRAVLPHEYPWHEGQQWAEPNHEEAVAAFINVFADAETRSQKCKEAVAFVHARYGAKTVGEAVNRRLSEILRHH